MCNAQACTTHSYVFSIRPWILLPRPSLLFLIFNFPCRGDNSGEKLVIRENVGGKYLDLSTSSQCLHIMGGHIKRLIEMSNIVPKYLVDLSYRNIILKYHIKISYQNNASIYRVSKRRIENYRMPGGTKPIPWTVSSCLRFGFDTPSNIYWRKKYNKKSGASVLMASNEPDLFHVVLCSLLACSMLFYVMCFSWLSLSYFNGLSIHCSLGTFHDWLGISRKYAWVGPRSGLGKHCSQYFALNVTCCRAFFYISADGCWF